ncbi:MAG: hypothetical protein COB76_05650 [Alphaproteobacteria bacterium]|nr:MAG: hypothetical protein COB76_05650 [Alphaproteobacteria bacterium]
MDAQVLSRQSTAQITPENMGADDGVQLGATVIDLPLHTQKSLDAILDYYVGHAIIPEIKLSGAPLDIVSDLIIQMRETVPEYLTHQAKDVLDFMVREVAEFCKARSVNYATLEFAFDRSYRAEAV